MCWLLCLSFVRIHKTDFLFWIVFVVVGSQSFLNVLSITTNYLSNLLLSINIEHANAFTGFDYFVYFWLGRSKPICKGVGDTAQ